MPQRSRTLVVVNFYSSSQLVECLRTARLASSAPLETVVVDNSCDPAEAVALSEMEIDHLLVTERNLGYGAAINLGKKRAGGEMLVLANPDLRFSSDAIDLLCEGVTGDIEITGPRLSWDDTGEWLLPNASHATLAGKVSDALATRLAWWRAARDRRLFRKRLEFWSLEEPSDVATLSGAVLCLRRAALDSIGGFDERFHLYFEEIDLERRFRSRGSRLHLVPAARCRHLYNQSIGNAEGAAGSFNRSEAAYYEKWYPRAGRLVMALAAAEKVDPESFEPSGGMINLSRDPETVVVEASPLATFQSAAGHFPTSNQVRIPPEILECYRSERLYLRVVDRRSGVELTRHVISTFV